MIELNTRTYGAPSLPALVMLHGLFGSAANWGSIARRLETRFRVLVPDLRNHGQSPHDPECGYQAMAEDLLGLLDRHGIGAAALVGHSMGGKVAMHLALNQPQRVARLAVVDIAPVRYGHDFEAVLAAFRAVDLAALRSRADADWQMATSIDSPGVRAFLLQNLTKGPGGWTWRANLAALGAAQREITGFPEQDVNAVFDGPTSFIYGERSDYVKGSYEAQIRRLFPRAHLCRVVGAGHWVYADRPQEFMHCLDAFLADRA
jgi:pimeloyl-ACP methyl ester carboxylesterase